MTFDYYYGDQAEQFSFYRIPKVLFTAPQFKSISAEAKILYGLLLDRMSLSARNGWMDELGRVYIIYTVEEIMDALGCADQKALKLLSELEKKCGLIERKRQGLGKPNLIFVKNFVASSESQFKKRENHDSGNVNITIPEPLNSRPNNTDSNHTDLNNTDSFPFPSFREHHGQETKEGKADSREQYRKIIMENIDYDILLEEMPYDTAALEEILELILDTVCSTRETIRISGDDKPTQVVKSRFLKLTSEHIRFVMEGMRKNTTRVRNIRQYLLASLYNASMTISNYYTALVAHDMAEGKV